MDVLTLMLKPMMVEHEIHFHFNVPPGQTVLDEGDCLVAVKTFQQFYSEFASSQMAPWS